MALGVIVQYGTSRCQILLVVSLRDRVWDGAALYRRRQIANGILDRCSVKVVSIFFRQLRPCLRPQLAHILHSSLSVSVGKDGKLLAQKLRRADKSFLWRHPDSAGNWVWSRKGVPNVLYNLPIISTVGTLWVVEGENLHAFSFSFVMYLLYLYISPFKYLLCEYKKALSDIIESCIQAHTNQHGYVFLNSKGVL